MFSEIWNYFLLPTLLSIGAFGIYYTVHPEGGNQVASNIAWYGVKIYSKTAIFYEKLTSSEEIILEEEEEETKPTLAYYTLDEFSKIHLGDDYDDISAEWWKNHDFDVLVLKKDDMYKIFSTYEELQDDDGKWDTIESPFVQVELIVGDEIFDIHKTLNKFYLKNTKILDKTFIRWFLKKWHNIENIDYELKIFDKDVNFFRLEQKDYVFLNDDGYVVKNEDDESEDDESEEEESEESEENEGATSE
jgi:hypothetical protein